MARPDFLKRSRLFSDFLLWFFNDFLAPLVAASFYAMETGITGNRIMFFRHDTWRDLIEPSTALIKQKYFEKTTPAVAKSRKFKYARV